MDPVTIGMLISAVASIIANEDQRLRDNYNRRLDASSARLLSQYQKAYSKINMDQNDITGFLQYVASRNSELAQGLTYLFGTDRRKFQRIRDAYQQAERAGYAQQHALNQAAKDLEANYKEASSKIADAQERGPGFYGWNSNSKVFKEAINTTLPDPYSLDKPITQAYTALKQVENDPTNQIAKYSDN